MTFVVMWFRVSNMDSSTISPFPLQNCERNIWVRIANKSYCQFLKKKKKIGSSTCFLVKQGFYPCLSDLMNIDFCRYLAPEYFQHGKVSDKTDVYAFGVVLLELITGWKPIESLRPSREENLVQLVCYCFDLVFLSSSTCDHTSWICGSWLVLVKT